MASFLFSASHADALYTPSFDTTPPLAPKNLYASSVKTTEITLKWDASSDKSGIGGYNLKRGTQVWTLTGTTFTDTGLTPNTSYTYTVEAFDTKNNVSPISAPLTVLTPLSTYNSGLNIYSLTLIPGKDGKPRVAARVSDFVGGISKCEAYVNTTNLGLMTLPEHSTTFYSAGFNLPAASAYSIRVKCADGAGNVGERTVNFTIAERSAPLIIGLYKGAGMAGEIIFSAAVDDRQLNNIESCYLYLNSDMATMAQRPSSIIYDVTRVVEPGPNSVVMACIDKSGNVGTTPLDAWNATAPAMQSLTVDSNQPGSRTFTLTAPDFSGQPCLYFMLDNIFVGSLEETAQGSGIFKITGVNVSAGQHLASALFDCFKSGPVTKNLSWTASSDTQGPVIGFDEPSNNATVSGTLYIDATVTDSEGVNSVIFKVDDVEIYSGPYQHAASHSYDANWDTKTATNGQHRITVVAKDSLQNSTSRSLTVTVNNQANPPAGLSIGLAPNKTGGNAPVLVDLVVNAQAADAQSIIYLYYFCDKNDASTETAGAPKSASMRNGVRTYNYEGVCNYSDPGTYMLKVVAKQGNLATEARQAITVAGANGQVPPANNPGAQNPAGGSSAGTNAPTSSVGLHPNGTLILDGRTVYLIRNGARAGFRDEQEYRSHGYNFAQAVPASAEDRALSTSGDVIKALEGSLVLDASDNRTVYMIGTGGTKRGFTTPAVFKGLGYTFNDLLKINLADYPLGAAVDDATAAHPDGALVKEGQTVWWIRGSQKQGFESMAVFNTYGFSPSKIVRANSADIALPQGPLVKFRDGTLALEGQNYYLISDGKKLKFSSPAVLTARGFNAANAIVAALAGYEAGADMQ